MTRFTRDAPTRWHPTQLRDPRCTKGSCFTHESVWGFIADCMDDGVEIWEVPLKKPPGKKGYYFEIAGVDAGVLIYVKLQLGSDNVIGRSFHVSNPDNDD